MDTLAALIHSLFAQSYREHPAPPFMEHLVHFLKQPKLHPPACENVTPCLQESADCAMITPHSNEERKNPHG